MKDLPDHMPSKPPLHHRIIPSTLQGRPSHSVTLLLVFAFLVIGLPSLAQKTKAQLQEEKKENLNQIREAEKILSETKGQKQNTLGELSALSQRIKAQQDLINSIKKELVLLSDEIDENNDIINALSQDIADLKEEYKIMVYLTYKANRGVNKFTFLFSAESFSQFLMRLKYLEQYSEVRKKQADQIMKVQKMLAGQVTLMEGKLDEKNTLLAENLQETKSLNKLKKEQNKVITNLQRQENKLKKDLESKKRAVARLDKLINDIIKSELEKSRRAKKSAVDAKANLSNLFVDNRSKLPWPVSGFVSQKFGRQNHPVLKGIVLENTGINIQTKQNEKVKAIFGGEVRTVAFVPLVGNTVLVSHGDYFTVYAGLKEVFVKTGQKVDIAEQIGTILTNKDGVSELKFEVRKNAKALDPQLWLVKRQ